MNAYYQAACGIFAMAAPALTTPSLHHPLRQLIALRIEHAELDALIDLRAPEGAAHDLALRRLKKRRLVLRDAMDRLERDLQPPESA
jgi:hypothetical protein